MVGIFTVLALTPLVIVYAFSIQFLARGIDSWFNVQIETA
jgi:nitrogen fixation/metabolism regulation signal transduction histidine kinase